MEHEEYRLSSTQHCTEYLFQDLIAEIVYLYLFKNIGVRQIEERLFGEQEFRGFLAKTILNYYGIDTSKESDNKGIYKEDSVDAVAQRLISSNDRSRQEVGYLLQWKRKID